MSSKVMQNITIVVRSVGERTEELSLKRLKETFGEENVFVVKNYIPFSKAIEESFKIAILQNKIWSLIIDADVFLDDEKIEIFINKAEEILAENSKLYCFHGEVFDNLFQCYRNVGVHLYQTKALPEAIEFIAGGQNWRRPETHIKTAMVQQKKYKCFVSNIAIGVHDYFQYYKSTTKKAILHSYKHDASQLIKISKESKFLEYYPYIALGVAIYEKNKNKDIIVDDTFMNNLIESENIKFPLQDKLTEKEIDELLTSKRRIEKEICINEILKKTNKNLEERKLRIFEKVKSHNGRRRLYFCGVKIFSYKRINKINKEEKLQNHEEVVKNNQSFMQINRLIQMNLSTQRLHQNTFMNFKAKHKKQEIVIFASGVSANRYLPIPKAVHIGVNGSFQSSPVDLDYVFLTDYSGRTKEYISKLNDYNKDTCQKFYGISGEWKFAPLISNTIPESDAIKANALRYREDLLPLNNYSQEFAYDLTSTPLASHGTIVFMALQFALWTYPKRIYLVGCDCNNEGYSYDPGFSNHLRCETIIQNYKNFKLFAQKYYPDIEIVSINPLGLKGVFIDLIQEKK